MILSIFFLFQWSVFIQCSKKHIKTYNEQTNLCFKTFFETLILLCYSVGITHEVCRFCWTFKNVEQSVVEIKLWWSEMPVSAVDKSKISVFLSV